MSSQDIYLKQKHSGYCIIINYHEYSDELNIPNRDYSHFDVSRFNILFNKLDFKIKIIKKKDLMRDLIEVLKEIANSKDLLNHEAIVIVINAHGNKNGIQCSNGKIVPYNSIINRFTDKNCRKLRNKPKIILFNCCREGESGNHPGKFHFKFIRK